MINVRPTNNTFFHSFFLEIFGNSSEKPLNKNLVTTKQDNGRLSQYIWVTVRLTIKNLQKYTINYDAKITMQDSLLCKGMELKPDLLVERP